MSDRIRIVEHKGQKIIVLDASNLKPGQLIALFPELQQRGVDNHIRLYALDLSHTHSNSDIQKASKALIETVKSHVGTIHVALVGLSGIQKIIASAVSRRTHVSANMNDAWDWLVQQDSR